MPQATTIICTAGGLRSLIATGLALSSGQSSGHHLCMLHLCRKLTNAERMLEQVHRQGEYFGIGQVLELSSPEPRPRPAQNLADGATASPLIRPQILQTALAHAVDRHADELIWPVQCDGVFESCARITEMITLIQTIGRLELAGGLAGGGGLTLPAIETPLLELNDQQLIELGGRLQVPFELSWSCLLNGDNPCSACFACRRRRAAFDAAGMVDPLDATAPSMH